MFLHPAGELIEDVNVDKLLECEKGRSEKVYKLGKAFYGLGHAPRAWYNKIEAYSNQENFEKCPHEHTLFVKKSDDKILIVSLYVDDLIYTGNSEQMFEGFKESMRKIFTMRNMGKIRYFLGVEIK